MPQWSQVDEFLTVPLKVGSSEWRFVDQLIRSTNTNKEAFRLTYKMNEYGMSACLPQLDFSRHFPHVRVSRVERIENPPLWEDYERMRDKPVETCVCVCVRARGRTNEHTRDAQACVCACGRVCGYVTICACGRVGVHAWTRVERDRRAGQGNATVPTTKRPYRFAPPGAGQLPHRA